MTKTAKGLLTFSVLSSLLSFQARADFYVGVLGSYTNAEYQPTSQASVTEGDLVLLQAQAGYFINDYIGLEGRFGMSAQRDNDLSVESLATGFAKLNIPVSNQVALYGLLGASNIKMDKQGSGSKTVSSASIGLGAHYAISKDNAFVLEFVNYSSQDEVKLNGLSFGFQHRF